MNRPAAGNYACRTVYVHALNSRKKHIWADVVIVLLNIIKISKRHVLHRRKYEFVSIERRRPNGKKRSYGKMKENRSGTIK